MLTMTVSKWKAHEAAHAATRLDKNLPLTKRTLKGYCLEHGIITEEEGDIYHWAATRAILRAKMTIHAPA